MLRETGTVIKIDPDALWVETVQKTTCGSCNARAGCGQHALAGAFATSSAIRVLLNGKPSSDFRLDQQVTIGIPEDVVVKGSLLIYLVPLICLLGFAIAGGRLVASDVVTALSAAAGLGIGGLAVRWYSRKVSSDPRLQPVLLEA